MLADEVQDHLLRDRRRPHEARPLPVADDADVLVEARPAVGLDRAVGRVDRELGREVLGHVGVRAGLGRVDAGIEGGGGLVGEAARRLESDADVGERMLHGLVGADRLRAEDHALGRVADRHLEQVLGLSERAGRDQHALGVQRVEHHEGAGVLVADAVLDRHLHAVEVDGPLVGAFDRAHRQARDLEAGRVAIDDEDREAARLRKRFALHLLA